MVPQFLILSTDNIFLSIMKP